MKCLPAFREGQVAGALAIALWVGIYAIIFGALEVALAFRLVSWARTRGTSGEAVGVRTFD